MSTNPANLGTGKYICFVIGILAAGMSAYMFGAGSMEVLKSTIWDSSDYLLLGATAAMVANIAMSFARG